MFYRIIRCPIDDIHESLRGTLNLISEAPRKSTGGFAIAKAPIKSSIHSAVNAGERREKKTLINIKGKLILEQDENVGKALVE